jgi:hypothetical protein
MSTRQRPRHTDEFTPDPAHTDLTCFAHVDGPRERAGPGCTPIPGEGGWEHDTAG